MNVDLPFHHLQLYLEERVEVLLALMAAHPLATLIVSAADDVVANHVPVLVRPGPTPAGQLIGHVARANPVWRIAKARAGALAIFQGPGHYISPRWYRSGRSDRKAVPTWDYAVVHVHGPIEWVEDKLWLNRMLDDMASTFESGDDRWTSAELPADQREAMLDRIVGFKISIDTLRGIFKLNQGSSAEDRAAVISQLRKLGTDSARSMADAIAAQESDASRIRQ
jgi:transcriptional regulator